MNVRLWHQSEIRIAINDESQGSMATNLRCDELLYYTFITHSVGERIFNIGEHLAEVTGKMIDCVIHPICLALLFSKMQISPHKLNNLCIRQKLLLSIAMLIGRLVRVNYQEISNCCIDQFWLTDWQTDAISDWPTAILLRQFCTVGHGFFIWPM